MEFTTSSTAFGSALDLSNERLSRATSNGTRSPEALVMRMVLSSVICLSIYQ
jgi:hypothetical protein